MEDENKQLEEQEKQLIENEIAKRLFRGEHFDFCRFGTSLFLRKSEIRAMRYGGVSKDKGHRIEIVFIDGSEKHLTMTVGKVEKALKS